MIIIDGARYSGSGTIVRQAVAFSALTGQALHLVNARVKRRKPGLRRQHCRVVEAILDRFAADQIILFAALAGGISHFLIPHMTKHIQSSIWLARLFLGAETTIEGHHLRILGIKRPM